MKNLIQRFIREEDGQDLIEYALLAAIIAIGAVVAMGALSTEINTLFNDTATTLQSVLRSGRQAPDGVGGTLGLSWSGGATADRITVVGSR